MGAQPLFVCLLSDDAIFLEILCVVSWKIRIFAVVLHKKMMTALLNKQQIVTVALVAMVAMIIVFSSCGHGQQAAQKQSEADSLINTAWGAKDFQRVLTLCDSLQQTGDISIFRAAAERGVANARLDNYTLAEEDLKKALAETAKNMIDSLWFYKCVSNLAGLYNVSGNYEGVLQLALPMIEEMRVWAERKPSDQIFECLQSLTGVVGQTQLRLGMKKEADKMYELSISYMDKQQSASQTFMGIYKNAILLNNIVGSFANAKDYTTAEKFLPKLDSLASKITAIQDPEAASYVDEVLSFAYFNLIAFVVELDRCIAVGRVGNLFCSGRLTHISNAVFINQICLKRYAEAADAYTVLDQLFEEYNMELSLDNMAFWGSKFEANNKAGRRDTALAVAAYVFEQLDSVITKQKNSDAAELATVYETQQKDAEIAQQQISLSRQRLIGTLVALVLLTTFFIIYTWYRRKAEKRLSAAHDQLQQAYDQLEETTTAKERIESELRIARDIQMSMVPGIFPKHEGLDMYAEMNPAKEVGGDLYGYVMQSDKLYFCVGDVSGKGVPASLFMAQSARLFRTLATEGLMPAGIAVRMNNELTEGNDQGMFVTMFIGLLHLETGRLDYCNCGHNAPVIDGQFLNMEYDNQPLGLWEDDPFYGESIDDIRGKQLLIYTDGLNEAENQQKELLGNKRMVELMTSAKDLDSHQVIDMLKEAVERHRDGAEPNDDLTLMSIRLNIICT